MDPILGKDSTILGSGPSFPSSPDQSVLSSGLLKLLIILCLVFEWPHLGAFPGPWDFPRFA